MLSTDQHELDEGTSVRAGQSVQAEGTEDSRVTCLVEQYCADLENGKVPDRRHLLEDNPEIAEALSACLDALDFVFRSAPQLRDQSTGLSQPTATLDSPPPPGVLGDFRILREIGRGGMGVVYEAEQTSLKRRVALKVLPFAAVMDPRHLQRFKNEAQAAASLDHPNIVRVHSVGCERGVHYFAMQYIEGHTLTRLISELRELRDNNSADGRPDGEAKNDTVSRLSRDLCSGRFALSNQEPSHGDPAATVGSDPTQLSGSGGENTASTHSNIITRGSTSGRELFRSMATLGIQAAEAIEHAHQMGIVHRDIKPSNLMVDANGHLWVTDFGLAQSQSTGDLTMTGDVLGTLRYMSPEQAAGRSQALDHHTDIYSLGATLYELLVFRAAFPGDDRQQLLRRIEGEEPVFPRRKDRAVPRDLETVVLKAMAKEPDARYGTARELADDLRRFLDDRPVRARRPSMLERAGKWSHRHRAIVWSVIVLLSVTSILSLTSAVFISKARDDALWERDQSLRREATLRKHVYAADVQWAWEAWRDGDVPQARRLLIRQQPTDGEEDLRGFPWYYLWELCRSESRVLQGHTDTIYHVAYSPDGTILASGGKDRTIVLWNPTTGEKLRTLTGHTDDVNYIAFSPDGELLATAGEEGIARLWDVPSGKALETIGDFNSPVALVLFMPDGKTLLVSEVNWSTGEGKTSLRELFSGQQRGKVIEGRALALSPDGQTVLVCIPDGTVSFVDVEDSQVRTSGKVHLGEILTGTFNHNGTEMAIGARDGSVKVFDQWLKDRHHLPRPWHLGTVRSVAFSADDRVLASVGSDYNVRLWDMDTGSLQRILSGHTAEIWSVAFSPDGSSLATASADQSVRIWNVKDALPRVRLPSVAESRVRLDSAAFLPDGKTLAVANYPAFTSPYCVGLWDVETGQSAGRLELPG